MPHASDPPTYLGTTDVRIGATRIALLGDTQRTSRFEFWRPTYDQAQAVLFEALADADIDAVLHLGDFVTWGGSARSWARFDTLYAGLHKRGVPVLPIVGNHDYMPRRTTALRQLHARFPDLASAHTWVLTAGSTAIVAVDSNTGKLTRAAVEAQTLWFAETVAAMDEDPAIDLIVGAFHHPAYTNSKTVRPSRYAQRGLMPALHHYSTHALAVAGHCHAYEHFVVDGVRQLVLGGGGGPLQRVTAGRFPDRFEWPGPRRFLHYGILDTETSTITVVAVIGDDTCVIDTIDCRHTAPDSDMQQP
ncbi:MAG: 3',5'-cyclic AMP phosphodiesterase CpdA [Myxococcota bacterium]|jgi:3',5'-cyclic AMP phosphodiesterase CpdA